MQTETTGYQFSHHTQDGLAVYVDEPAVMRSIPSALALPDSLAIPSKPDAAFLSKVLRDPSLWPEGFVWNYDHCRKCAVGLAANLWSQVNRDLREFGSPRERTVRAARHIIDDEAVCAAVFTGLGDSLGKINEAITPTDVANALDAAIAAQVPA